MLLQDWKDWLLMKPSLKPQAPAGWLRRTNVTSRNKDLKAAVMSLPLEETKLWSVLPQTSDTAEEEELCLSKPVSCSDYLQQR